ncbi:GntR family transcriptional regulator [Cohnella rhizosphaerae]|uniref:GntR family transcriptional regulator n=1 Tax=Cohnella rhizosphaerae TaxID=1457232 RepID=A0A9X4L0B3_9BACL|nr:GntR family transcriptional regulator [Cohnella rhizosphaerae]MDG0814594.1 GntR family transcriptional regulator [Cohnella rhizosphaerae]
MNDRMTSSKKRTPLYSQIRDYILANIQQLHWQANDQLPTEQELAEKFNVSRFTVKKAMAELVQEGLIYRIQGKGSFISQMVGDEHRPVVAPAADAGISTMKLIVLLTPHIQSSLSASILTGAESYLADHGYQLIVRSTRNEQELERRLLVDSVRTGVRGVLIFPVDGETYNEEILRLTLNKFPVVVIDRYLRGVDTNCVCSDNIGGAFDATSHLIGLGHHNIAFVVVHDRTTTSLEERIAGYERALSASRYPFGPRLAYFESENGEDAPPSGEPQADQLERMTVRIQAFLEQNPAVTAVFAATTYSGLATLQAATNLGIKVPEQLSVVFCDDFEHSALSRIPPTCVVQQESQLGIDAAKLLLSIIDNPLQERKKLTLPTRLVLRQSTAPPSNR